MYDELPGLSRWIARTLPPSLVERCLLPSYYELVAQHLPTMARRRGARRLGQTLLLRIRVLGITLQCVALALPALRPFAAPSGLAQDLRFAIRVLWKKPGFTMVAVCVLALGIGANTAMFSIVHSVLLRPLPYAEPAGILELNETARGRLMTISPPNFLDWKAENSSFSEIAAYTEGRATLTGGFEPEQLDVARVSAGLFPVLGVSPARGRAFTVDDEREGARNVVMLGHARWQSRFGGDPGMLGRLLTFDGLEFEVIGIMPEGVSFPGAVDIWFPLQLTPRDLRPGQRGAHYLKAVGRLLPNVTVQTAVADLSRIEERLARQYPAVQGYGVWARPLLESMVGNVRRPLLLLLGAVVFVLLIACANVSNLLLARASTRRSEIALRAALGASRGRIVRQLLAESLVLASLGGVVGVLLAAGSVHAFAAVLPPDLPRVEAIGVNVPVLLFSLVMSIATGVVFGVLPSWSATTADVGGSLKEARRDGTAGGSRRGSRQLLVAAEVALALVLLTGAGLALRSFEKLSRVDPGFDPSGVVTLTLTAPDSRYPDRDSVARFYERLLEQVRSHPQVSAAGAVMMPPLSRASFGGTFDIVGADDLDDVNIQVRSVTAGYFEALRIPLRRGRRFTSADRSGSHPVVIVSEEGARRFWPGRTPIGQRLRIHVGLSGSEPVREVVGVVGDVKLRALDGDAPPVAYVPHGQYGSHSMTVFARTTGQPLALVPFVKSRLTALDDQIAMTRVQLADRLLVAAVAQPRFRLLMLGLFSGIALALAAVGLYGVLAFSVSQRQGEIGVRMALGADQGAVLRLVLRQGLGPVAAGMAAGLVGAAALTQLLAGLLYDVSALDPATYTAVVVLLGAVAAIACYVPARRATRIDPILALRAE